MRDNRILFMLFVVYATKLAEASAEIRRSLRNT